MSWTTFFPTSPTFPRPTRSCRFGLETLPTSFGRISSPLTFTREKKLIHIHPLALQTQVGSECLSKSARSPTLCCFTFESFQPMNRSGRLYRDVRSVARSCSNRYNSFGVLVKAFDLFESSFSTLSWSSWFFGVLRESTIR